MQEEFRRHERKIYLSALLHGVVDGEELRSLFRAIGDPRERKRIIAAIAHISPGVGLHNGKQQRVLPQEPLVPEEVFVDDTKEEQEREYEVRDPLALYFREMEQYPLLTPSQERALFGALESARIALKEAIARSPRAMEALVHVIRNLLDEEKNEREFLECEWDASADQIAFLREELEEGVRRIEYIFLVENGGDGKRMKKLINELPLSFSVFASLAKKLADVGKEHESLHALQEEIASISQKIFLANLRLVVKIANHRYWWREGGHLSSFDLIQEGNIGLLKAIEKFDLRRETKLSTYATWWIRQTIARAIADQSRTVRIPVHMQEKLGALYRQANFFMQRTGRVPSRQELARELPFTPEQVKFIGGIDLRPPRSLDEPLLDGNDDELGDFVADQRQQSPEDAVDDLIIARRVHKRLMMLTPREERVMRMRFGIGEKDEYTLEEVGEHFGVTRERIRQIESKALRRMRRRTQATFFQNP